MKRLLYISISLVLLVLVSCNNRTSKRDPDNYVVESIKEDVGKRLHHAAVSHFEGAME